MDLNTDILIVGAGIAGLLFALEMAENHTEYEIIVLSQAKKEACSSFLSQGGIAASFPEDHKGIQTHINDTLKAGSFVNNKQVVESFVKSSFSVIQILEKWGVEWDKNEDGSYNLALEGGHSQSRIFHHKDYTGRHIMKVLYGNISRYSNIKLKEDLELLKIYKKEGNVNAALLWDNRQAASKKAVFNQIVIATGGLGGLYQQTTTPPTATGTAVAIAKDIGAKLENLHYIQFHPTAFYSLKNGRLPLISEAVRGAGAILRDINGKAFMTTQHPLKDLAPRDIVARCIVSEIQQQQAPHVYLDCRTISKEHFRKEFPGILQICLREGIDPTKDWIPIVPVAHYSCGGVKTDSAGDCNFPGLNILGEAASTGFHGANRLASNSLLEACLMAIQLAATCTIKPSQRREKILITMPPLATSFKNKGIEKKFLIHIRSILHQYCNIIKSNRGLDTALGELKELKKVVSNFSLYAVERYRCYLIYYAALGIVEHAYNDKVNKGVFFNINLISPLQGQL